MWLGPDLLSPQLHESQPLSLEMEIVYIVRSEPEGTIGDGTAFEKQVDIMELRQTCLR